MTRTSGPSRRAAAVSARTVSSRGQLRANRMMPPRPDRSVISARSSGIAVPSKPNASACPGPLFITRSYGTRSSPGKPAAQGLFSMLHVPRVNISVPGIPQPLANYTPAARAGDLVFAAGQLASDFKAGIAAEARVDPAFPYYGSAIKKQTRYVLENLARTFQAAGTSLSHVVKAQVFHTDLANFSAFDEVWREFFPT